MSILSRRTLRTLDICLGFWDISQPSCKCGASEGAGLWVNHNYSIYKIELTPSWTYQTPPFHMCYPLHTHLFISETFQADVEVLGPKRSFFSMPLRAEPFSGSWLNFFRKERGCLKSVFSCEAGDTRIAWITTVQTDTVPSEKLPWQILPYFCGCFSTFQGTRRSFHRSIRPHTTDGTSRTPCACHVQVSCPAVKRLSKLLLSPPKILWQHHTQSHRTDVLGTTVAKRLRNKEKRLLESSPENVKKIFIFNNSHSCFFLILCLTNCFLFTASTF